MKKFKVESIIIYDKLEKELKEKIIEKGDYGKYRLEKLIRLSKEYNINPKIIKSLRSQVLKQKTIFNHYLIKKKLSQILKFYNDNDIITTSKHFDLSPLSIMRVIILNKYKIKIKSNLIKKLDDKDKKQLEMAMDNDIVSQLDQDDIQKESINYENKIKRALERKNIKFKTQEQLVEEQKLKYGKAIKTPDFLLDSKIMINGKVIKWLEIKNFYGSNTKYFKKKVQNQVDKYYKEWGTGCIVFRYGFNEKLKFNDNLIISF
jgi:hypothetical protein